MAAAQDDGQRAGVEQGADGAAGAGLPALQIRSGDGDVTGVVHCPVQMEGQGPQGGADRGWRGGCSLAPLVAPDTLIAAEPQQHGRSGLRYGVVLQSPGTGA